MDKKVLIEKLYQLVAKENVEIYKDLFDNTDVGDATDSYWKESLEMYKHLSGKEKRVFLNVIRQIGIDTVSTILALLDGVTLLDGQEDDFILKFEKTNEKLNGDLQDLFLEYDENNR